MRIIDLALKDLTQIFRDKRSLLFMVAMPIIFTIFMGYAYKSGSDNDKAADTRIPLGWVNNDPNGLVAAQLYEQLSNSDSIKVVVLTPETMDESVRKGEVAGVLVVPQDFSQQAEAGKEPQLTLIADTSSSRGQSLSQLLRSPVMKTMSAVKIASMSAETAGKSSEFQPSFALAGQAWSETDSAALVKVEMAVAEMGQAWYGDNPYNQASPGILIQFAIMGLVSSATIILLERKQRTRQRMMTTSMRPWQITAGHMLAMFAVVFMQIILLVVFGQLAMGVNYAREPLAILLVSVALSLWVAAMGLLISALAKDDSQVVLFALVAMFVLSGLGGTWFPLEVASGAFAAASKLMPSAWAMAGYQNILVRGQGLESAWLPVAIMLVFALGFFLLATWVGKKTGEA